jgi:hypothetical protein
MNFLLQVYEKAIDIGASLDFRSGSKWPFSGSGTVLNEPTFRLPLHIVPEATPDPSLLWQFGE